MDIYKYAKDINYAGDYLDTDSWCIFKIQEYGEIIKKDPNTTERIRVTDISGNTIGYANRKLKSIKD